jgi:hypothetical protein
MKTIARRIRQLEDRFGRANRTRRAPISDCVLWTRAGIVYTPQNRVEMERPMRGICGLSSLLCFMLPGALRADTMYSLSGTYGSYSVSISFDTSLTGSALDGLTSDNITPTVSDFLETNTIPGNGSASLNVTISTDSLGNITTFSITDTSDQVVTNTEDSGETLERPPRPRPSLHQPRMTPARR